MSVIDQNWDFLIDTKDYEETSYREFVANVDCIYEGIHNLIHDKLSIQSDENFTNNIAKNFDIKLKCLVEENKQLKKEIDAKVDSLSQQQTQYEKFKKDRKLLSQEIKERHEGFLMAKKYYKKYLNIYFTIESRRNDSQTIFLQFFTEVKKETEDYSIRLQKDTKTGKYELLNLNPKLDISKELKKRLHDTNNLAEIVCSIRLAFLTVKGRK